MVSETSVRALLPLISWGLLGSLLLLLLHRLIAQLFPRPSAELWHSVVQASRPLAEQDGDGIAEVYTLDKALMNAELERPGSSFWLYYRQPGAAISRLIGSLLMSFLMVVWILGAGGLTCVSISLFLVGLGLSLYPYQTWWMSRPALRKN